MLTLIIHLLAIRLISKTHAACHTFSGVNLSSIKLITDINSFESFFKVLIIFYSPKIFRGRINESQLYFFEIYNYFLLSCLISNL